MLIKQIKYSKGDESQFKIPNYLLSTYEKDFKEIFKIFYKHYGILSSSPSTSYLNENENIILLGKKKYFYFKKILNLIELKEIFLWSKNVLQEIFTEKKKEENYLNKSYFSYFFGGINDNDLLSKEEEEKINEILTNSINEATYEIINKDIETKFKLIFLLNEGNFKFSNFLINKNINQGFGFNYKNIYFEMKKGEYFIEINTILNEFGIFMFTVINGNNTTVPITFKKIEELKNIDEKNINNNITNKNNKIILNKKSQKISSISSLNNNKNNIDILLNLSYSKIQKKNK
jgi:hypothetical protein